jgi:hypothetical protein
MTLHTVAEASDIARCHPVTTRRALEAGELHGFQRKVGGRWSIQQECLQAWIEGGKCAHKSNVIPLRRSA